MGKVKEKKEKIARYCPKCGVINWIALRIQTTRKPITCGACKIKSEFFQWALTAPDIPRCKANGYSDMEKLKEEEEFNKRQEELKKKYPLLNKSSAKTKLKQETCGRWLCCPVCGKMKFRNNESSEDWMRCTECTNVRKLALWLTEDEWKEKEKAKQQVRGAAQRLVYCPACNAQKWITIKLFKQTDQISCLQCKRRVPLSAYRLTSNPNFKKKKPKPKKQMEIEVTQRHITSKKETQEKIKIDAEHKGMMGLLEKNELIITLLILSTTHIRVAICHNVHREIILELRATDNVMTKAKAKIEDMLKKMYTGKPLKKFLAKRLRYIEDKAS